MLKDESYSLNDKGEAYAQQQFLRISDNVKFAFRAFAISYGSTYKLKLDDSGWVSFTEAEALKIRNRITHPKSITHLVITNDELATIQNAARWYIGNVSKLLKDVLSILETKVTCS